MRQPRFPFTINRTSPQAQGLIGWWPDGVGSYATDLSGYNRDVNLAPVANQAGQAILRNGAKWELAGVEGGRCLYFPGGTSDCPTNLVFNGLPELTIVAWMRRSSIIQLGTTPGNDSYRTGLALYSNGFAYCYASNGADAHGRVAYTGTSWTHAAMVFFGAGAANADRLKVYLNGIEQSLTFFGAAVPTTTSTHGGWQSHPFKLGTGGLAGSSTGWLEDPRVYNRALSAVEVRQLSAFPSRWQLRKPRTIVIFGEGGGATGDTVDVAVEIDAGGVVSTATGDAIDLASEIDAGGIVGTATGDTIDLAAEVDAGGVVSTITGDTIDLATEIDAGGTTGYATGDTVDLATEIDAGGAVSSGTSGSVQTSTEQDVGVPTGTVTGDTIDLATEIDTGGAVAAGATSTVSPASEVDAGGPVVAATGDTVDTAAEVDQAIAAVPGTSSTVSPSPEHDVGIPVGVATGDAVDTALDRETGVAVTVIAPAPPVSGASVIVVEVVDTVEVTVELSPLDVIVIQGWESIDILSAGLVDVLVL